MEAFSESDKIHIYDMAVNEYGMNCQMVVAVEELSECAQEICKVLRGKGDMQHLAEEIADAIICLEQIEHMYGLGAVIDEQISCKLARLMRRIETHQADGGTL